MPKYNLRAELLSHIPKLTADQFSTAPSDDGVDLTPGMPPVFNQGELGSCSANALAAAMAYDDNSMIGSRLFLYYNERTLENTVADDSGAALSDGVKALNPKGLCSEDLWPYSDDPDTFQQPPPQECYDAALAHEATTYNHVEASEEAIKAALSSGYPVVVGIYVFESFESDDVAQTGTVPLPQPDEQNLGGHAVVCVGYTADSWIMRNSWGPDWGSQGNFTLPLSYLTDPNLCITDYWVITGVSKDPAPGPKVPISV
eukprot:TRINITY_DN5989_c0_g1_i1.p1 TRINITY_DN5989_c0_g1~~TRINITY_DN5989_c0_g1_i1.p1  ORF type:complete len:266 (+),score=61.91 TRINITY_DN5989_c0_g1_i1:26-799(+)